MNLRTFIIAALLFSAPVFAPLALADTVTLSEPFDSVTPPALPSDLTFGSGFQTEAATSYSAPNGLSVSNNNYLTAFTPAADTSGGNVYAEVKASDPFNAYAVNLLAITRANGSSGVTVRYNCILDLYPAANATNAIPGVAITKNTGGGDIALTGNPQFGAAFAGSTWYRLRNTTYGSGIYLTVQRLSDGKYLATDGTWTASAGYCLSATDSSITGAGNAGIGVNGGFTANLTLDDVQVGAVTAAPSPALDTTLPAVTVTPGQATPTSIALSWTAATGGAAPVSYQVLRTPDNSGAPGTFAPVGSPTTALTFTDTGLTAGTKYWYEVAATDSTTPTARTGTSAAVFGTTTILPTFALPISVSPAASGDLVTIPAGAVIAGTNAVASVSLYEGTSAGAELASPVATVSSPSFPLTFTAQSPAPAGAGNYFTVKAADSAGYVSAASGEVAVKTSALAHTGTTRATQTFVAAYGPAFTGLSLGFVFYDATGAVFARRSTAGVFELTGQGIYSVEPSIDTGLTGGYILWDAPSGTSAFTEPVTIPAFRPVRRLQ